MRIKSAFGCIGLKDRDIDLVGHEFETNSIKAKDVVTIYETNLPGLEEANILFILENGEQIEFMTTDDFKKFLNTSKSKYQIDDQGYSKCNSEEEFAQYLKDGFWENEDSFINETGACFPEFEGKWFLVSHGRIYTK